MPTILKQGRGTLALSLVTKSGESIPFEYAAAVVKDATGAPRFLISIGRDLTERRRAEEALRRSEAAFREVFESVANGLFIVEVTEDGSFRIADSNQAEERLTTVPRAAVVGKLLADAFPPAIARELHARYSSCLECGSEMAYEESVDLGRGELHFHTTLAPVRDQSGRIRRIIGSTIEITARKQAEREREQLIAELQQALAEIRTLRGIIPICMYCKGIRDDKGSWDRLESYISSHSEAVFSHSICDKCLKEHFPDFKRRPDR
jgi:PAS domain S-box-containing protein